MLFRSGVGGVVEVVIATGWLEGWAYEVGDPDKYEGALVGEDEVGKENEQNRIPAGMFDLEPLRRRKVWGTDVYTDDSDVLALCLHSGWLRLGAAKAKKTDGPKSLVVRLVVAPTLLRYHGCSRQGLRSRSWGNGHDGVSLLVESITAVEVRSFSRSLSSAGTDDSLRARRHASNPEDVVGRSSAPARSQPSSHSTSSPSRSSSREKKARM